ncbi:class I SAM-dependent methyltransferase [Bradyrhizobium sp.]|uniref:class I SAM-dependent methyltransferase n=1 Tax=Bradyrhizobium sp. TaxID=376 RepID=UPI002D3FD411|nr:class I SAM-dependent methyltransferase [Bradyrhizobium sp.]HZR71560.1 class I SAM-dependent methyltransferase [Bradyrhizobium sp.]
MTEENRLAPRQAERQAHWEGVYTSKEETGVSWFQDNPAPSLELIERIAAGNGKGKDTDIVDIGGGASRLPDHLLQRGFRRVAVLDISQAALDLACLRIGRRASEVQWIAADVTEWNPSHRFDIWHDRAAFHFLVDAADRAAYIARMAEALRVGGHAIIATFASDGPEKCSGLPVNRYDPDGLARELGDDFTLVDSRRHDHATPWNATQRFQFSLFRRRDG